MVCILRWSLIIEDLGLTPRASAYFMKLLLMSWAPGGGVMGILYHFHYKGISYSQNLAGLDCKISRDQACNQPTNQPTTQHNLDGCNHRFGGPANPVLRTILGVRNSCVHSRFHPIDVKWNLTWTRKFSTPTFCIKGQPFQSYMGRRGEVRLSREVQHDSLTENVRNLKNHQKKTQ